MELQKMAQEINRVAHEHGWWEDKRPDYEILALIHSEWSEALEEYRANRDWVWYGEGGKPEGIGIEIADGVIRLLDWLEETKLASRLPKTVKEAAENCYHEPMEKGEREDADVPMTIYKLHVATTAIPTFHDYVCEYEDEEDPKNGTELFRRDIIAGAESIITFASEAIGAAGYDLEELIRIKHEFNKTRPYRHGNKVC